MRVLEKPSKALAKNLRVVLTQRKWTQSILAEKIGVTTATTSRLLSGDVWVSQELFQKLSEVCQLSYGDLLQDQLDVVSPDKTKNVTISEALRVVNSYEGKLVIKKTKKL